VKLCVVALVVSLLAGVLQAQMEVRENGTAGTLVVENEAVGGARDFGIVNTSTQSAPLNIYITNVGSTSITFGPSQVYTKTGANPTDFTVNATAITNPLPPGQSTSFTIIFYRTTVGISTATINLFHNAPSSGTSPFEINLQGEAVPPTRIIQVNLGSAAGPVITHQQSATGTPRDFGNQDVSMGPSAAITIFVSNMGSMTLGVTSPQMGGVYWYDYVINSSTYTSSLAPGASTSFTVAFDPSALGARAANVQISHNGTQGASPFDIPVTGDGTAGLPGLEVREGPVTGTVIAHNAAASGGRDFGNQLVTGGSTPDLTITIRNTGGATISMGTPALSGTNPSEFTLDTTVFQTSLVAGSDTSFAVAFDPASVGAKSAQVTFAHSDTNVTSPFIVNVTGTGVATSAPAMELEQGATSIPDGGGLAVGSLPIGAPVTLTFTIRNSGTASLNLTGSPAVAISNQSSCTATVSATPGSTLIAPTGTTTFSIDVTPLASGAWGFELGIDNNDPIRNPYDVTISGTGIGTPSELRMITQPTDSDEGELLATAPVVAVTDAAGNIDTTDNTTQVQVAITTGTGNPNAVLTGFLTLTAAGGQFYFNDLEIDRAGGNYTLTFTDITGPYGTVESDPFDVSSGGGDDGGGEEDGGCSTSDGESFALLLALAATLAAPLWRRKWFRRCL
jgi:hypothetical protein